MRRFELVEGKSSKFWEIALEGDSFEVRWGRIGTNGQRQTKSFATNAKAEAEHDKLVAEKVKKGYQEVGAASAEAPSATSPRPPSTAARGSSSPTSTTASTSRVTTAKPAETSPATAPAASTSAAAPAATGSTAAAKRASKASASEPAATASVLSQASVAASARPTLAEGEIALDDATRRLMAGVRGVSEPPKPAGARGAKALAAHVETLAKIEKFLTARGDAIALEDAQRAFASLRAGDVSNASLDEAAAHAALVGESSYHERGKLCGALVDLWVAGRGLLWAFEAVFHTRDAAVHRKGDVCWVALTGNPRGLVAAEAGFALPLRAYLAAADEPTYASVLARARALDADADDSGQLLVAFLFPEEVAWSTREVRKILGRPAQGWGPAHAGVVLSSSKDAALAEELIGVVGSTYQLQLRCVTDAGAAPVIYATLAHLGRQATDTLVACLHVSAGAEDTRLIADALARIGTTEALEALMAHAHHKDVVGALAEATQRFPTLALSVLARTAARARSADQATTILRGLIRREGEALRPAIAALDDAERRLCEKLLADATPKVEATEDELPAVLRRPRWEGARKAGPPQLKGLAPERLPSEVRWPAGRREEWSAFVTPTSWDEAARSLGLPSELRPFIVDGKDEKFSAAVQGYKRAGSYLWGNTLLGLPPAQLERLLRLGDLGRWYVNERDLLGLAALRELEALDFLLAWVGYRPAQTLAALLPFGDVRIAPHAAAGLGKKTVRADAEAWLRAHPRHAAAGLLPLAFDKAGKARDAAMAALRFVASGDRGALDDASRALGAKAAEGIEAILDFDELDVLPTKMPKLPSFFVADAFERPVLKSGKALPSSAVETLGLMLALSKEVSEPYAGVGLVKDACTPESLAAFGWELFQAWTVAGSPGKEGWAFAQLGWLGDDECARRLTPLIRAWPGESAHARAVLGLDVLAGIGTDVALMHLNGIAEKLKFKGLQEKAREKIAALAEARGLSPLELADRLVPDLGLDEDGSLVLDFGPRQFRVGFDEGLKPFVKDEEDKLVRELPKPKKTDDAEKAQAATNAWKALKKDARAIASQQVARLELAMVDTRRWDAASFETFLVRHPLVSHLVKRLVWGVYEVTPSEGEPPSGGELRAVFRVAEDGTYADVNDEPFALAEDAMVGVAHPLEIPAGAAAAMAQVLADYAIVQPFAQLGRETYRLTSAELAGKELRRVEGRKVSSGKVLGLETRGWRRGAPQDGGGIWWMERLLPGQAITAVLELDPGMVVGDLGMFPEQTLKTVYLSRTGYEWRRERLSELREIPAIAASELLRDLESLH